MAKAKGDSRRARDKGDKKVEAPTPNETGYVTVGNGVELYYEEFGNPAAPVLVLVHETGGGRRIFDRLIGVLAPYYRVISYDLRGHGRSSEEADEPSYQSHAHDLFMLLNALQLGKVVLVGVSDGGAIALQLACNHQERVVAVVTISTPLNLSGLTTAGRLSSGVDKRTGGLLGSLKGRRQRDSDLPPSLVGESEVQVAPLSRVQCDALIITGDNDPIKREHSKLISTTLPHGELRFVDEGGRDILSENSAEVCEMIRHWLVEEG